MHNPRFTPSRLPGMPGGGFASPAPRNAVRGPGFGLGARPMVAPKPEQPLKRGKARPEFAGLALPKFRKAKRSKPRTAKVPEASIQAQVEAYCPWVHLECFHIPAIMLEKCFGGSGARGAELGELLDASEMVKGYPDCSIFDPRFPGHFLPLELKTEIGKLDKYQKRWQKVLGTKVPRSFEEARAMIDAWKADLEKGGCGGVG